jgi:hypothetical protein
LSLHEPAAHCVACLQNEQRTRHGEPPIRPLVLTAKDRAGEPPRVLPWYAPAGLPAMCLATQTLVGGVLAANRLCWHGWLAQQEVAAACHPCTSRAVQPAAHRLCKRYAYSCTLIARLHTLLTRADVLLSLAAAHVTGTGPHVAGIVLTDAERGVGWVEPAACLEPLFALRLLCLGVLASCLLLGLSAGAVLAVQGGSCGGGLVPDRTYST